MDNLKAQLQKDIATEIETLERKIKETKQRLPAHSAKPSIMMELFAFEDRYNELCRQLEKMDKDEKDTSICK